METGFTSDTDWSPGSRYDITSSLVIIFFSVLKASSSWGPHLNFTSFHVNSFNGTVRVEYYGKSPDTKLDAILKKFIKN